MNKPSVLSFAYGWGGFLVDLVRIARFRFTNPHSYVKFRNIDSVRRRTGADQFIETGTYRGVTARRAASVFGRVITIELDEELAAGAREYLADLPHVEVVQGDALQQLPEVLSRPELDNMVVLLDGHFSGGETAMGAVLEPAVEAISQLSTVRDKVGGFIVDDFRDFGRAGFPKKSELLAAIEEHFLSHGYEMTVHLDQVLVWKNT
jgi:hypothetical protein